MPAPEGKLTPVQFELMLPIWQAADGLTVGEIWGAVRTGRRVSRNTVLNLVDRLEKRGWLTRQRVEGVFRYKTAVSRQAAEASLAADFVDEFFDGSAANLVMSLLGSRRIGKADIERLKRLIEESPPSSSRKKKENP